MHLDMDAGRAGLDRLAKGSACCGIPERGPSDAFSPPSCSPPAGRVRWAKMQDRYIVGPVRRHAGLAGCKMIRRVLGAGKNHVEDLRASPTTCGPSPNANKVLASWAAG